MNTKYIAAIAIGLAMIGVAGWAMNKNPVWLPVVILVFAGIGWVVL